MTLLQIKYVLTIADAGSMTKAAENLYISQPALTKSLRELETELGISIFSRSKKGIQLTNDGIEFIRYARQVYQQYELLENKYVKKGETKQKFGVSTQHYSFVDKAFVETVRQFGSQDYEFSIRETKTFSVIRNVARGHSELGILYQSDFNRAYLDTLFHKYDLEFHKLIECQAYVYLWKGHPLAQCAAISLEQLADYPCLSFEQGSQSSLFLAEEILSHLDYPQAIHATDRASMLNLMKGVNGYTLCSGIICSELNGDDYVAIPFEESDTYKNSVMEIGYVQKRGMLLSQVGEVFLEAIRRDLEGI
jgi:DNA-binding transcriptional LysR family regulator